MLAKQIKMNKGFMADGSGIWILLSEFFAHHWIIIQQKNIQWLNNKLTQTFSGKTIVVTQHAAKAISAGFKENKLVCL